MTRRPSRRIPMTRSPGRKRLPGDPTSPMIRTIRPRKKSREALLPG